ncbi:MAG: type IV secretory system conjugative DNA transfer family protein [Limnobacter sp.]|uniref:type IV secretory system conjugative DNA transfer family protein n=1 Tax=Limnobacter sp. TaxID=2003368 RepID=UPI00391918DA
MLEPMMTNIANRAFQGSEWLISNTINIFHPLVWSGLTMLIVTMVLSQSRLREFEKPTWPKVSNLVRICATSIYPIFWLSGFVVLSTTGLAIAGYVLAFGIHPHPTFAGFSAHTLFWKAIDAYWTATSSTHTAQAIGLIFGIFCSLAITVFLIPSVVRQGLGPKTQSLLDALKKSPQFDPNQFINTAKGLFIGIDINRLPIYVPWRKIDETHFQIMGSTGAGKGVSLSLMGKQFIRMKKTVIFFDPKGDSHAKSILLEEAKASGREFVYLNLKKPIPQVNPFAKTTAARSADLLIAAFELRSKGSDGDYYKGREEDCAYTLADQGIDSLASIIGKAHADPVVCEEENFLRKLRKLERSKVFMTAEGPDLEIKIQAGAVIYIECSSSSESVWMAQRLLLLRIMQIIEDRENKERSVAVVLDEFKYMLSPAALTALGVMRSSNCHCLLAFQAIGDLADNPTLNEESAKSAVLTNTAIKMIFRIPEVGYADELSRMTVQEKRFDEVTGKQPHELTNQGTGSWREVYEPTIPANVLTNLPMPTDYTDGKTVSCGVLFIGAEAKAFSTSPVPHSNSKPTIYQATPHVVAIAKAADLI